MARPEYNLKLTPFTSYMMSPTAFNTFIPAASFTEISRVYVIVKNLVHGLTGTYPAKYPSGCRWPRTHNGFWSRYGHP